MNNPRELVLILLIVLAIAGPAAYVRYRFTQRHIRAEESIAESLRDILELMKKKS